MTLLLNINTKAKRISVSDQSTIDILRNGYFGEYKAGKLMLEVEEGLYLVDVRKAACTDENSKPVSFNDIANVFIKRKKLMARYFTFKDWRDRGLIIKSPGSGFGEEEHVQAKRYPSSAINLKKYSVTGIFFPDDMVTVIDDDESGKGLYENFWLGQYGTYKVSEHGNLNKLDIYETLFLIDMGVISIKNFTRAQIVNIASSRRADIMKLYDVYKDWRTKGYVVKTGFKFGTNFRIYFPGAKPIKENNEWIHSKHVLHVFPRDSKLIISEWARAIRVAHSVRKTFILAIPGKTRKKKLAIDFELYHRRGGDIEIPGKNSPRFGMLSLSENERIGGSELSAIINEAKSRKLELVIAIADSETSVTYYKVRKVDLPKSEYEYYEIDWMQP
ncbi:tRNA-intron lyase [Candidatus Marsarchaeota archaeon]|jgi:tRNA-intron endonuclease|nr:tRNA-intron lyase [Candidatus Marsarchaeota archaeon]